MINSFIKGKAVLNPVIHRNGLGEIHNEEGPAITAAGFEEWRVRDKKHRIGGPAVIHDQRQEYWEMNRLHRLDGPAIEDDIHGHQWWVEGKRLTEVEFLLLNGSHPKDILSKAVSKSDLKKLKEKLIELGESNAEEIIQTVQFAKEMI